MSIDSNYKGRRLVVKLIGLLKNIGVLHDCYKILLDCADHNVKFYEMVSYFSSTLERVRPQGKVHVLVQKSGKTLIT